MSSIETIRVPAGDRAPGDRAPGDRAPGDRAPVVAAAGDRSRSTSSREHQRACGGRQPRHRRHDRSVARRPRSGSALRIDDADRTETAERLAVHFAAGRLDLDEYEDRLAAGYAARTEGDLAAVLADLPVVTLRADVSRRRAVARGMVTGWLALAALFLTIWALTGAGYFWPVWPMLGTGISTLPGAWAVARGTQEPSPG